LLADNKLFSVFCVWTVSWIFYCISLVGILTAVLTVLFFSGLYGLEAVTMSNANLRTLYVT